MEAQPPETNNIKWRQRSQMIREETRGLDHRQRPEVSTPGEPLRLRPWSVLMSKRWEW